MVYKIAVKLDKYFHNLNETHGSKFVTGDVLCELSTSRVEEKSVSVNIIIFLE